MDTPDRGARHPSRRDVVLLGIGAFAVVAVPLARARRRLVRRTLPAMGTIAEIAVVHRDPHYAHGAIDAAFAALERVERAMTRFDRDSDVGRANRLAASEPVRVGTSTALVLEEALRWAEGSDGAFDPCVGRMVELWDVGRRHEPPPAGSIQRLAGRRLHRALDVDRRTSGGPIVRFLDATVALDLGGIAKGYGVDRAVHALREWGVRDGLVNVGGDLYALGGSEGGDPWTVGVRSPSNPARLAGSLALSDQAVATSGDYLQYFDHGGRRYHHLLDPATGSPRVGEWHSVTVIADTCMGADAAATAAFGLGRRRAERLLARLAPGARLASVL